MFKILLAEPLDEAAERRLEGGAVIVRAPAGDEKTLCGLMEDCDALLARTHTPVTRAVLAAGKRLRVVGVAGVGLDRVDTRAAEELGIAILHTPAAASDAVAELTVGLMLQLLRPVPRLMRDYKAGHFRAARAQPHGRELRDLTIGILGLGRIGARVGRICAAGFGAKVIYNDIADPPPPPFPATAVDKPALWASCDILTLHAPLTAQTHHLIAAETLAQLRPTALLINTARGKLVDTDAITEALSQKRLAGAALDVTHPEPLPPEHPLFACETCVLTPHIAARTFGGLRRMYAVVEDVLAFLRRGPGGSRERT